MALTQVKGSIKLGKQIFYPVEEIVNFLKKHSKLRDELSHLYLDQVCENLRDKNPIGLVSRQNIEKQTGGMIMKRTLANLDCKAKNRGDDTVMNK